MNNIIMVYQLYNDAMQLTPRHRETFVKSQCNDKKILKQVLALISADQNEFTLSDHIAKEINSFSTQNLVKVGNIVSVYELTQHLGQGGMGTVFKAVRIDGRFEQTVAIKVISSALYPFFNSNKLINEANFMAKLNHPNICSVYDAGITEDGLHYIVMEYLDGQEISNYFKNKGFSLNEKLTSFATLCTSVNYAHQMQVVHGDLKPANIIINQDQQIKVLDFGISQVINNPNTASQEHNSKLLNGISKGFSSPELINGAPASVYSDVYALGQILSVLITQHISSNTAYNKEINAIINKATASLTTERYASVSELKHDINLFLTGHVVTAYQPNNIFRLKKFVYKRHPISVSLAGIFTTILIFLMASLFIQYQNLEMEKQQTDIMLGKFSLVLDLDFDRKSAVELSLANNYASRGENEKSALLYNKIITRFDSLINTNIAFNAGQKLINLLVKSNQLDLNLNLNNHNLLTLKNNIEFIPGTKLPINSAQAFFYYQLINIGYERDNKNINKTFNIHTKLIQDIKSTYWQELTNQQKQTINYSYAIQGEIETLTQLQRSFYFQQQNSSLLSYITKIREAVIEQLFPQKTYLVKQEKLKQFLENKPIFWAGTHENDIEHEGENTALFSKGTIKTKNFNALYKLSGSLITMESGEGSETDEAIYVSSTLALTVPLQNKDLIILTYENLINNKKNQKWSKKELLTGPWYHIYDQAIDQKEVIQPVLMKINFTESFATLNINEKSITVPWELNQQGVLELHFSDNDQATLQIIKQTTDEEIIITMNKTSGLQSLFIKDKKLAQHLLKKWTSLL
ncbi:serine/threonine-protein kinase [Psychromonas sp. L1A2]|uniref:serine/threonine-protein kinase n=1 Tax=Psychromonas sp. L1A2 TaxID=2686356 RepID=UPI00135C13B7|nr:serine/threonine-protein kinase [Psychromonas sp. L1A2]